MAELYEYRTAGRQPFVIGCYAIALTLVLLSASGGASAGTWALWALITGALVFHLLAYPVAGSRIDATHWTTFIDRRRRCIALDRIAQVTLHVPGTCRCTCTLTLHDGASLRLPKCCLPPAPTLLKTLRTHRIKVVIDRTGQRPSRAFFRRPAKRPPMPPKQASGHHPVQ